MRLYRIDALIEEKALLTGKTAATTRVLLAKKLGIDKRRLYAYRSATSTDSIAIPFEQMVKMTNFFGCTVDDLINSQAAKKVK